MDTPDVPLVGAPMQAGPPLGQKTKSNTWTIVVAILATTLVVAVLMYFLFRNRTSDYQAIRITDTPVTSSESNPSQSAEPTTTPIALTESKVYTNQYLSITLPAGWSYSATAKGASIS